VRDKPRYLEKILSQCNFVHRRYHMDRPGFIPGLRDEGSAIKRNGRAIRGIFNICGLNLLQEYYNTE
jgi:hypothetical protein